MPSLLLNKRTLIEYALKLLSAPSIKSSQPNPCERLFVLRNNDIGDLLVITPLFQALKKAFPCAKLAVGVGKWNLPVLRNNPYVDEILETSAPWHNKNSCRFPSNSPRGLLESLRYIYRSTQAEAIRYGKFDIGIDVLGSPEGSLLFLFAQIRYRLGVVGYAGGHSAAQANVTFNPTEHVGRSALRFAELLGCTDLPSTRPQLFLSTQEIDKAQAQWSHLDPHRRYRRIVLGPGGGFPQKCWPRGHFKELVERLTSRGDCLITIVGGEGDIELGQYVSAGSSQVQDRTGKLGLRETFALVSQADLVICNSSMLMHVAPAFDKPALVLLGDHFPSASAHAKQWGHGSFSHVLGKDENYASAWSPADVISYYGSSINEYC